MRKQNYVTIYLSLKEREREREVAGTLEEGGI